MGGIGQAAGRRAKAFGMKIVYQSRSEIGPSIAAELNARRVDRDELLAVSDDVSLHRPYGPATHHLMGAGLDVHEQEPRVIRGLAGVGQRCAPSAPGSATVETRTAMTMLAADNSPAVLSGVRRPPGTDRPIVFSASGLYR